MHGIWSFQGRFCWEDSICTAPYLAHHELKGISTIDIISCTDLTAGCLDEVPACQC